MKLPAPPLHSTATKIEMRTAQPAPAKEPFLPFDITPLSPSVTKTRSGASIASFHGARAEGTSPSASTRRPHLVLVGLGYIREQDPRTTLGHASLLAAVRAAGDIDADSLDYAVNQADFRREEVLRDVRSRLRGASSMVGIGAYIWNDAVVRWLIRELREGGFMGDIVLGGPQISYTESGLDELYPEATLFVRGYGETALVRLLHGEREFPGVQAAGRSAIAKPAQLDFAQAKSPYLDGTLPPCDFVRWETQRGCPYSCSFCQHTEALMKLKLRAFARERLDAEMRLFVEQGVKKITVLDPLFNLDREHCTWVLHRLGELGYRGSLSLQCRFEQVTAEFVEACTRLDVSLEFGLQTIHAAEMEAVGRNNKLECVERAIAMLLAADVPFEVSLIYGLPAQTVASFRQSIDWCFDRHVPSVRAFPLMLLRGTGLDVSRERWSLEESGDAIPLVVSSSTFNREDWREMRRIADALPSRVASELVSIAGAAA